MDIEKMTVDPKREEAGVLVDYDDTTKFLIGSLNSRRYKKVYRESVEKARRVSRKLSDEQAEAINIEVYATAILLGWEGVKMKGSEFPATEANRIYVLTHCPQVREFVVNQAANFELFKVEQLEAAKAELGEDSATS